MGATPGMNPSPKQALIGIDVSEPAQNVLVEERRLDGRAALAKAFGKVARANLQRVRTERCELRPKLILVQHGQPAEAPKIGEARPD